MRGLMMDFQLTLPTILERAHYGISSSGDCVATAGPISFTIYVCGFLQRAIALAEALTFAGLHKGERVATLMWNHETHLEAYFGVPCAGGVLHPLNLRLHPSELAFIANHAEDRFLVVDDVLLPCLESFRAETHFERIFVVPYGCETVKHDSRITRRCWRLLAESSSIRQLMRTMRRRCVTRRERREDRKEWCIRIGRKCCIHLRNRWVGDLEFSMRIRCC